MNKILLTELITILVLVGILTFLVLVQNDAGEKNSYQRSQTNAFVPGTGSIGYNTKNWNAPTGGEISYAENLSPCVGTELFNSPPAVDDTYNNISPLGHTSSYNGITGHVFPVDHMSFDLKHVTPGDRMTPSLPAILLAPADVEIYQVSHTTYEKDGKVTGNDYAVFYAPCREVTGYFGHVTSISHKIQIAIDHADQKKCHAPFTTGGEGSLTFKQCNYSFLLSLKSAEKIGTAGGPDVMTQGFDYGVYDMRIQPLPFVDQKYWTPLNLHAVCGLYYYPDGTVKKTLLSKINNTKKDTNGLPDCGTNMWDKAGTIQGNWILPNTPTGKVPDPQGLTIMHLYYDPSQGLIDWGGTIAPAGTLQFKIKNSGFINRDPAEVKTDGMVYCFQDPSFGPAYSSSIMVQLVDSNSLKIQYLKGICPSSLTFSNPTTYVR